MQEREGKMEQRYKVIGLDHVFYTSTSASDQDLAHKKPI